MGRIGPPGPMAQTGPRGAMRGRPFSDGGQAVQRGPPDSQMRDSQMRDSQMRDSQMLDSQMRDSQMRDSQMRAKDGGEMRPPKWRALKRSSGSTRLRLP